MAIALRRPLPIPVTHVDVAVSEISNRDRGPTTRKSPTLLDLGQIPWVDAELCGCLRLRETSRLSPLAPTSGGEAEGAFHACGD